MNKKILIIDDHEEIREMYGSVFTARGYEVYAESNGLTGAMKAAEITPDVILLDIMMPQMDGFAVLEAMNQNENLCCKVLIISNLENEQDEKRALELGALKFLRKSEYTPDQVVQEVEKILVESPPE